MLADWQTKSDSDNYMQRLADETHTTADTRVKAHVPYKVLFVDVAVRTRVGIWMVN